MKEGNPMIVDAHTIEAAFDRHFQVYASEKDWIIPYHVQQWQLAERAFTKRSSKDFHRLYEELRRRWQVFRGGASRHWSPQRIFRTLMRIDARVKAARLSALDPNDVETITLLWRTMSAVASIKRTANGGSLVAASKFLHFMNPRLFVIVDREMMWNWVFNHRWLWDPVDRLRKQLSRSAPPPVKKALDTNSDYWSYLPILLWTSQLMKKNPAITTAFVKYVSRHASSAHHLPDLQQYDAAAVEWFLLGLVELPPAGIEVA